MKRSSPHQASFLILLFFFYSVLTIGVSRSPGAAESPRAQPSRTITIAYSGISPSQAPAWVANEQRLFEKYGLDVQLVFIESGSRTVQTLISGDVAAAQVAGTSVIRSALKGSGVVMIAGFLNTMDYKLIVARDITRPDQLKGKTVAVSRVGSSSDFATRYALDKYGLIPDKDVSILQIGSQPARFSALETGKIHGAMIAVPLTAKAKKLGFNTLADLQMLGLEYQHTGLAVTRNLIKTQPDVVRNILRSFVEAIHYMKVNREESLIILAKYLRTDDADALEEAYESIVEALIPKKPYPTLKGIDIMLRELGTKDPDARSAKPEEFVDLTFIKELDDSGFIDRLYESVAVAKAESSRPESPSTPEIAEETAPTVEAKVAPVAEERTKPVARPIPTATERATVTSDTAKVTTPATQEYQEYIVKAGDYLSKLSERFYDSPNEWRRIYEANRETVKNPDYIYIGQKLIIPPDDEDQAG